MKFSSRQICFIFFLVFFLLLFFLARAGAYENIEENNEMNKDKTLYLLHFASYLPVFLFMVSVNMCSVCECVGSCGNWTTSFFFCCAACVYVCVCVRKGSERTRFNLSYVEGVFSFRCGGWLQINSIFILNWLLLSLFHCTSPLFLQITFFLCSFLHFRLVRISAWMKWRGWSVIT